MASISSDPNGRKRVLFVDGRGDRKAVRLGKMGIKAAETIRVRIEALSASIISNTPMDGETAAWLRGIGDDLYAKLAALRLVTPRSNQTVTCLELGDFIDSFMATRTDHKPNTRKTFAQTKTAMLDFFGVNRGLDKITPGDADDWLVALRSREYAPASIATFIKRARQMFRYATRKGLIAMTPFGDLKAPAQSNKSREVFVTREVTKKVLGACPDHEWRLLLALARYGGLRTPSESLNLRLADVDWENNRMMVYSPKTAHLPGKESRMVPLFPELRPSLEEAFDRAESGTVYFINRYRGADVNLRTQLLRIIRKAGLQPWERLWQNLRSSRETELAETFPLHVVTSWIGNTERVATKHYLQVTDDHFAKAAQGGAKSGALEAQKQAQQADVTVRNTSQEMTQGVHAQDVFAKSSAFSDDGQYPRQESNL